MAVGNSRILVLTSWSPLSRIVVDRLCRALPVVGIAALRARLDKHLLGRALGPRLTPELAAWRSRRGLPPDERLVERALHRLRAEAVREIEREIGGGVRDWPRGISLHWTLDFNAPASVRWCRERSPDLVLLYRTRILRSEMLGVARVGILNTHPSLLPDFRGSHSEIFQFLEDRLDRAGISAHFVDAGLDTGPVLLQHRWELTDPVDPFQLQTRNSLASADLMVEAARRVLAGEIEPRAQDTAAGRTYRLRDLDANRKRELLERLTRLFPDRVARVAGNVQGS